jgi:hypothetical protein
MRDRQHSGKAAIMAAAAFLLSLPGTQPAAGKNVIVPDDAISSEKYQVNFHFLIKNKKTEPVTGIEVSIPLPEDDAGQKITGFQWKLERYASKEVKDQFGQKLLQIDIPCLAPQEKAELGYSCNVEIKPVKVEMDREKCGSLSEIPPEIKQAYGNDVKDVYELNSPVIAGMVAKFKYEYPNLVDRLEAMHDWVAATISYKLSGHWVSAPEVIARKTGSCSEYSFVFGALCRSSGLPTRMVGSSHLRTSKNFPYKDTAWHRWIEVYLPPYGWIPFDPTLDRGKHPSRNCSGSYDFRTLRVSRGGVESNILGHSYIGCTNHSTELEKDRYFIWVPIAKAEEFRRQEQKQVRHEKPSQTSDKP